MIKNKFLGTASLVLSGFTLYSLFDYLSGDIILRKQFNLKVNSINVCPQFQDIWRPFLWKFLILAVLSIQKTSLFQGLVKKFLSIFELDGASRSVNLIASCSLILLNLFYGQVFPDDFFVWDRSDIEYDQSSSDIIEFVFKCFHITSWALIALSILGLGMFAYVGFIFTDEDYDDEHDAIDYYRTQLKKAETVDETKLKFPGILLIILMFWVVPRMGFDRFADACALTIFQLIFAASGNPRVGHGPHKTQ